MKETLRAGLTPILAVGETLDQRLAGEVQSTLETQLREGLRGIEALKIPEAMIAYEPVCAIGTGQSATPYVANDAHGMIRGFLENQYGETIARRVLIQYGGSVGAGNSAGLMSQPNIDGALVGRASTQAKSF